VTKNFGVFSWSEGVMGLGQRVEFTCNPDDVDEVKEFLKTKIRDIDSTVVTKRSNVSHGGLGRYTRYDITQHKYAGGGSGYIEVLEIKHPPDHRCGIVIHEHCGYSGSVFIEWETLADAEKAFESFWSSRDNNFAELEGFLRRVSCKGLCPWFYAVGNEELLNDFAISSGLEDDPVYRLGERFVVYSDDNDGQPAIKTCMGTRYLTKDRQYGHRLHLNETKRYRRVHWHDGTIWDESYSSDNLPRPLRDDELWIAEAINHFHQLLAGQKTDFTIKFIDGNQFRGRIIENKSKLYCEAGTYYAVVNVKGEDDPREGSVDFEPSPEAPDVIQYITQHFAKGGREVERVEITKKDVEKGGKKWAGVFFESPQQPEKITV
jgi:hypothetical protein